MASVNFTPEEFSDCIRLLIRATPSQSKGDQLSELKTITEAIKTGSAEIAKAIRDASGGTIGSFGG